MKMTQMTVIWHKIHLREVYILCHKIIKMIRVWIDFRSISPPPNFFGTLIEHNVILTSTSLGYITPPPPDGLPLGDSIFLPPGLAVSYVKSKVNAVPANWYAFLDLLL